MWVTSIPETIELVLATENDPNNWPFISTYSFPNGHTKENAIPQVDRLFFDFDVPDDGEYRGGEKRAEAWARDMSRLLVRTRKVAQLLLRLGVAESWQAVLSGHKGVHLDLTFPPVSESNGTFEQFQNGMASYADSVVEYLKDATGLDDLDEWIDVSSVNLGQLRRVPNTKHLGATESFGEDRFCVPVTLAELAEIGPAEYIELTRSRRPVTDAMWATPNEKAGEVLTQRVRNAPMAAQNMGAGSTVNVARIEEYEEVANDAIGVEDLPFVLSDRPCVLAFIEREDAFKQRAASHLMEMKAITEMIEKNVPIETMVDFFRDTPGFDEEYTRKRIDEYISRGYKAVSCEKIWHGADDFCVHDGCQIWIDAQASDTNR
ncbi:hypothetical protein HSR121_2016 [Halapricum desulfuricans]|uniref:Uncharacterized protein n=2 Tax=Halapricum desulfuricans TaxID=2841257 RepID=A0A897N5K2_9EURY|nr:hypothetical protein HSR121_2016 [Halapricum desulfuricans]